MTFTNGVVVSHKDESQKLTSYNFSETRLGADGRIMSWNNIFIIMNVLLLLF